MKGTTFSPDCPSTRLRRARDEEARLQKLEEAMSQEKGIDK